VEFHPVKQRAVSYRAGVGGPLAQGFPVAFPAAADVAWRDGGKGHQFHGVDLDLHGTDPIPAPGPDFGPAPQPEGHGDVARHYSVPQILAELHPTMLRLPPAPTGRAPGQCPWTHISPCSAPPRTVSARPGQPNRAAGLRATGRRLSPRCVTGCLNWCEDFCQPVAGHTMARPATSGWWSTNSLLNLAAASARSSFPGARQERHERAGLQSLHPDHIWLLFCAEAYSLRRSRILVTSSAQPQLRVMPAPP
jgi:hypothetical protein